MQKISLQRVPENFRGKNKFIVQAWYLVWLFLFRLSPHCLNFWRIFLLRLFGAKCSYSARIRPSAYISYPWNFSCGEYSFVGDGVYIDSLGYVTVGDNVSISNRVYIASGTHDYKIDSFDLIIKPVKIESEAWLAINVTVLPGVCIGFGTVVAACSLVTKTTGISEIWAGLPAKRVGSRN